MTHSLGTELTHLPCTGSIVHLAMLAQTKCSINLLIIIFLHASMHIIWPVKVYNLTQECTERKLCGETVERD